MKKKLILVLCLFLIIIFGVFLTQRLKEKNKENIFSPIIVTEQPEEIFQKSFEAENKVRSLVIEKTGVKKDEVKILEVKEVSWPDSCLGVAKRGEMCLMVITPGYQIKAEAKGEEFTFHTNENGSGIRESNL